MHQSTDQPVYQIGDQIGTVAAMAIRVHKRGPMKLIEQAQAVAQGGLTQDIEIRNHRGISLLSQEQWQDVLADLGRPLPWEERRANVLIDCGPMLGLIGMQVRIGDALLDVTMETKPCKFIESLHTGLFDALKPDGRGGVCCRVHQGGSIRVGDAVSIVGPAADPSVPAKVPK
jgi:MOSC domain-containing protein YiiM